MSNQTKLSDEIIQVRQTLFKDYLNAREQVQRSYEKSDMSLTPTQASQVLAIARNNYRKREVQRNEGWFQRFHYNVNKYYGAIKLGNWGSFQDR